MTDIGFNNILFRHLCTFVFPKELRKKSLIVRNIVLNFSTVKPPYPAVHRASIDVLIQRLRAFTIREEEGLTVTQHEQLNTLIHRLERLQPLQNGKPKQESNEDLLKQIKALEQKVKANSVFPSGHALSLPTKIAFNNLLKALDDVTQAPSAEVSMILSQDRIRILTSDLVYLSKREHLFHVPKLT